MIFAFVALWLLCGVLGAGGLYPAYMNIYDGGRVDRAQTRGFCLLLAFGGFITLLIVTFVTGFFASGWRLWGGKQ